MQAGKSVCRRYPQVEGAGGSGGGGGAGGAGGGTGGGAQTYAAAFTWHIKGMEALQGLRSQPHLATVLSELVAVKQLGSIVLASSSSEHSYRS
jgi:hypothetical protein